MEISISKSLFNPLYWHLDKYMNDPNIRYVLVYGGSSAAKTYSVVQKVLIDSIYSRDKYLVLRKYSSDIEDSIFADFTGITNRWKLSHLFTPIKNKISNVLGGVIRFRGMDDPEKVKGITNIKWVVLEELTQFDNQDFKQLRKRLRGRENQKIIGMWNPISEEHWIKKEIIDKQSWFEQPKFIYGVEFSELSDDSSVLMNEEKNTVLIKTTFKDNYWITGHPKNEKIGYKDVHVLADFENDKKFDYDYYRVYALGEWGRLDSGGEFYKSFDVARNVEKTFYDPTKPLHLSFDENVNPYLAVTIWQTENNILSLIDEIALTQPNNTLQHVLTEIEKRYYFHESGMYIYGDATSRKADVKLEKGYNFFTLITNGLKRFHPQIRVPLSNPSVMVRGLFINDIFKFRFDCRIVIGEHCKHTINDLRYVKQASDGTKFKEKARDEKTGVSYELYGHHSDTVDYIACHYFQSEFIAFKTGSSTQKRVAIKVNPATIF